MNSNLKYFLVVANELNISRAAKRLYISQQCLSRHIKRLETEYDTILFYRKPKLALTLAGEKMVETLQQIQTLQSNLSSKLKEIDTGEFGRIRVTVPQSRFKLLMVPVLQKFHAKYPNVLVELHGNTTAVSEQKLLDGQIDMFVGISPAQRSQLEIVPLQNESLYIIGIPELFKRHIPAFDKRRKEFQNGISLSDLRGIPMIGVHNASLIGQQIENFVLSQQEKLNIILLSNDAELNIVLANMGYALSFCAQMHLSLIQNKVLFGKAPSKLIALPLKNYNTINTVCLVYYKDTWKPRYMKDFIELLITHSKDVTFNSEVH